MKPCDKDQFIAVISELSDSEYLDLMQFIFRALQDALDIEADYQRGDGTIG